KENLVPTLQMLKSDRVSIASTGKKTYVVEENLDSAAHLYEVVGQVWEMLDPSLIERGAIYVLKHTFIMPRTHSEEVGLLGKDGLSDEHAESTLGVTTSFRLVQSFAGKGLDESVLFNPYIWRANQEKIAHAIVHLPSAERSVINASIETVSKWQAYPLASLQVSKELITNSHSIGLIDLVEVYTGSGDKQEFVFTPHLTTHPDVTRLADDLLNDVRAVLACVSYGEHYSRISRLGGEHRDKTINTLRKLLRQGEAGDATAIGVDYQLLESRGIITAIPTSTWPGGRFKMELLRSEPIEIALKVIEDAVNSNTAGPLLVHTKNLDPASFFAAPEQTRISATPALGAQPEEVKEARNYFLKTIRKEVF
ncbi:MAG TPA: hypothetical protein VGO91_05070, partial [Pyrinomonadaceae bacterium]|nr:hypothetical protein [Pyrinomonadaceae bacterium]